MEQGRGRRRDSPPPGDPTRASQAAPRFRPSAQEPPRASDLTDQLRQPQLGEPREPSLQRSSRTTTSPPGPTPPNPDVVWTAEPEQKHCSAPHRWRREEPPWSSLFQGRCPVHKGPATVALSSKCLWSAKPDQPDCLSAGSRQTRRDRLIPSNAVWRLKILASPTGRRGLS